MTTVSLELSRQLQERWPEWETGHYWCAEVKSGLGGQPLITNNYFVAAIKNKRTGYIAPNIDELRVFALELIESYVPVSDCHKRPIVRIDGMYCCERCRYPKAYDDSELKSLTNKLKNALIQGCDPTAEFVLSTFGRANNER